PDNVLTRRVEHGVRRQLATWCSLGSGSDWIERHLATKRPLVLDPRRVHLVPLFTFPAILAPDPQSHGLADLRAEGRCRIRPTAEYRFSVRIHLEQRRKCSRRLRRMAELIG